ncbi:tRNA (5-methylaminomethyl-2-thiouridine)(34)-methyltransferase MnmD [Lutimaribacter sp. EGI FJ00015]|uniref:tRNA (5-methylaminomethyl-2-thiouridine)(34)-methyltransferase MnmD n=1 Tax=Lutimaribacter degradans TaxID=2945989 RepID=A0ACC6A004_9RHOB|nr:tRNA (5-methylaminomethyl-2-thiouridine)(34)-methyltransferase MnmD [Lutimaribacter sp. EGI FJ00013]MCM2563685.1 tRNA (5-methylaminomethyl-2-thiouridine)(34)-methyltransferase MnmD [Lutimaribacter sp. EGI FJ00013]MCO0614869.1 tRNA (5-methylaminomethyl-2-thiouridine)(34)-methyltransferase MnmD [Lutimaribacter sp. EGI FJ00015]MCO0637537.1 tRNA (5-methylaminomethyl-2-thiouridine)(34)-methyltransferase MnmD [Lutimaribacter sp. EGI FJ00014]
MQDQQAQVEWRDGAVPVSTRFNDPYFSLENGLDETRHTFLSGNDLPARFVDGFRVAELGFGTGLNALATLEAWIGAGAPGHLRFTSFEGFPMRAPDMAQALSVFPGLASLAAPLLSGWRQGKRQIDMGHGMTLHVIEGDARQTLPGWDGRADAWFLDGFSPAKNPELWGADLMQAVARHTLPGGSAATYTAAGHVRRALAEAGFDVSRQPGYGRKRHMTTARMPGP